MQNSDTERLQLSAFADHLLRNQLADDRHARYMVHWVRRYLAHPSPASCATLAELSEAGYPFTGCFQHPESGFL